MIFLCHGNKLKQFQTCLKDAFQLFIRRTNVYCHTKTTMNDSTDTVIKT